MLTTHAATLQSYRAKLARAGSTVFELRCTGLPAVFKKDCCLGADNTYRNFVFVLCHSLAQAGGIVFELSCTGLPTVFQEQYCFRADSKCRNFEVVLSHSHAVTGGAVFELRCIGLPAVLKKRLLSVSSAHKKRSFLTAAVKPMHLKSQTVSSASDCL